MNLVNDDSCSWINNLSKRSNKNILTMTGFVIC